MKTPTLEEYGAQIQKIRSMYPENLLARHFSANYVEGLDLSAQKRLWQIIRSGLEHPASQMGAYAQNNSDYDEFRTLLEPMIRDYHTLNPEQNIAQHHDWSSAESKCNLQEIAPALGDVSMRVRVGRNLVGYPLSGGMTKKHRLELEKLMIGTFEMLIKNHEFGGQYVSLTPGSPYRIDDQEYQRLINAHQMFRDMRDDPYLSSAGIASAWPHGRGMYVSHSGDFIVWVGEEDHLRIMSIRTGGDLAALFNRLHEGIEVLAGLIPEFAHSPTFGYLTSCPTNLGTAMRASLHLPLPAIIENEDNLEAVKQMASKFGLSVRGAGGEHTGSGKGGILDISPSARLGVTENEIMQRLFNGTAALWALGTQL